MTSVQNHRQRLNGNRMKGTIGIRFFLMPIALAIVFLVIISPAYSQDYKRSYKYAKDFFDEGMYNLAMESFKPLIAYDRNNPYVEYASYFYALSAYNQGYHSVAKDMLIQIKRLYPEWNQLPEVTYWLAKIYFDQREYFHSLQLLRSIESEIPSLEMKAMKRHYLKRIDDVETLYMMLEEYPGDEEIARAVAYAIGKQPYYEQDVAFFEALVAQFNFNRSDFISDNALVSEFKDVYRVSLLFPFLTSTLEPTPAPKRNQAILDLYMGMRMGLDTLLKKGINIELLAYDTERDPKVLGRLLETDELRSSDLLVGPLFPEELPLVMEFSKNNKINMINPVTNNSEFLFDNSYSMLFQPTHETIGIRSAEEIAQRIPNKNCIVFFGETPKDSVMAFSFMKRALELDIKIVLAKEIKREKSSEINTILATPTEFDKFKNPIQFKMKLDSIGSIFVASEDPLIYTKVLTGVQTRGDSVIIFGHENWLNNALIDFGIYERLHVMLAAPNFTSFSPSFMAFRKKFISMHGTFSTNYLSYSRIGFEFMWFIGNSLTKHGTYFQLGLISEGTFPGLLTPGFSFNDIRDNQQISFIAFKNGELVGMPVTRPYQDH